MARGFTQTPGLDYHETYSPTVRLSTLRTVLACDVRQGIKFRQMDIKSAYLNAPIDEEIFLEQPEGFKQGDSDMVCKLKRSLYGLKQSVRNWYECLAHQLQQLGFHSLQHDKCLWTQKRGNHHCWALVWVDDIVYGSTDEDFGRSLRQRWANSSQLVTLASCVVPGHCIQSGTRRFDVEPQTVHIKLADEVRNAQLPDRFNSLTRKVCTQQRRPARRRFKGMFRR